jgi:hypothetical protein
VGWFEEELEGIDYSGDPHTSYEEVLDELYEGDEGLMGLDIGVAGVALSLSVATCILFTSCMVDSMVVIIASIILLSGFTRVEESFQSC